MAKLIALQAGHQNIKSNCITALHGSTGAPGEVEFTVRVRDRLKDILLSKKNADGTPAFQIQLTDANYNCKGENTNFALFLAIHYEADIHGMGGGFADIPDPSVDVVTAESKRIKDIINSEYFAPMSGNTGIDFKPQWTSNNVKFYYMWKSLTASTPCVLIECGVGQNAHDKIILADTDRVCNAIARGICKAFNVPFDTLPPSPPAPDWKKKYDDEVKAHQETKNLLASTNDRLKKIKDFTAVT